MTATRILSGLERSDTTGPEADAVARLGFLEWAFGLEGDVTATAARLALESPAARAAGSPAARAFVGFLTVAARAMPGAARSRRAPRGRSRRAVH